MNRIEKVQFDTTIKTYMKKNKIQSLIKNLFSKLLIYKPDDINQFLIDQLKENKRDITYLFFGDENEFNEKIFKLLSSEKNIVYFIYNNDKDFEILSDFVEREKSKIKFIFNFPKNFHSILEFNKKSFYYDKIFYVKSLKSERDEKITNIKNCFSNSYLEIDNKNFKNFLNLQIKLSEKDKKNPKILILNHYKNSQNEIYKETAKLLGIRYLDYNIIIKEYFLKNNAINKNKKIKGKDIFSLIKNFINRSEYQHFGYLMNFSIDLDFTYFEYLAKNDFDLIFKIPEDKFNEKNIDLVFYEDSLQKYYDGIFEGFDFKQKKIDFDFFLRNKKIDVFNIENKISSDLIKEILLNIK